MVVFHVSTFILPLQHKSGGFQLFMVQVYFAAVIKTVFHGRVHKKGNIKPPRNKFCEEVEFKWWVILSDDCAYVLFHKAEKLVDDLFVFIIASDAH